MEKETRDPGAAYTVLAWSGAAVCVTGAALIFATSGAVGIPVAAAGAALVTTALVGQRRLRAGRRV